MAQKPASFKTPPYWQNRMTAHIRSEIEQQQRLLQRIQSSLPEALKKQVRHSLIKDNKLLIYTDSAVWASQLRFYNKIILAGIAPLTRETIGIMQVKIMTIPTGVALQSVRKANIPSADTIESIRNHSLTIMDNQLQQALLKLSSTLKRLSV
jgi:hypothetical protein